MIQKELFEYCKRMRELLEEGDIELAKKGLDHTIKGLSEKFALDKEGVTQ